MVYTEFVCRILLALGLGFAIGLERQLTGHSAGIRINVLICIGSAFFTLFPQLFGSDQTFRIAAAIIQGVGFLCSGVIFKESASVRGINTAATLWCTSAIGVLSSSGMYAIAATAAGILILSNILLRPLARKIMPLSRDDESEKKYKISVTCQEKAELNIRMMLINSNTCKTLFLTNLESGDVVGDKIEIVAEYDSVGKPKNRLLESIVGQLLTIPEVVNAGWEIL
ncbi:MAG: MgtC/SapB family protein [Clostridia bacterium]|nr:MgtC/SapB family protein [Clostridia bacterium]